MGMKSSKREKNTVDSISQRKCVLRTTIIYMTVCRVILFVLICLLSGGGIPLAGGPLSGI